MIKVLLRMGNFYHQRTSKLLNASFQLEIFPAFPTLVERRMKQVKIITKWLGYVPKKETLKFYQVK